MLLCVFIAPKRPSCRYIVEDMLGSQHPMQWAASRRLDRLAVLRRDLERILRHRQQPGGPRTGGVGDAGRHHPGAPSAARARSGSGRVWRLHPVGWESGLALHELSMVGAWFPGPPAGRSGPAARVARPARRPRGLAGLLDWYLLYPIHTLIFSGMARELARQADRRAALEQADAQAECRT